MRFQYCGHVFSILIRHLFQNKLKGPKEEIKSNRCNTVDDDDDELFWPHRDWFSSWNYCHNFWQSQISAWHEQKNSFRIGGEEIYSALLIKMHLFLAFACNRKKFAIAILAVLFFFSFSFSSLFQDGLANVFNVVSVS